MLDNFLIILYLITILFVGIFSSGKITKLNDYANLEDRIKKNKFIIVATIFATSIGGGTIFGIVSKVFAEDLSYSYALTASIAMDFVIAKYLVPLGEKFYGLSTAGQILERYYGTPGRVIGGISTTLITIGYLAAQISVSAHMMEYFVGSSYYLSVIISYIIVIIYTSVGGLRAVIITDILQFIIMCLAIPLIVVIALYHIGGIKMFFMQIPIEKYDLPSSGFLKTIGIFLSFCAMSLHPSLIQRIILNKNTSITQHAVYIKVQAYIVFIIIITIIGLAAKILFPFASENQALQVMIDNLLPPGVKGFAIIGLLAAVMSTIDSNLNIASFSVTNDLIMPVSRNTNQRILINIARIITVLIGGISIIIALSFENVLELVIFSAGFWSPMVLTPLIAAFFNLQISKQEFIISALLGFVSFGLWELSYLRSFYLKSVFIGTSVNFISFAAFYFLKRKYK